MPTPCADERQHPVVLHGLPALEAIREEWDALATRTGAPIFSRPAWLVAWQRHLAPVAVPELLVLRDGGGALTGVLPLARMSRRLHTRIPIPVRYLAIAGAGVGSADHNGPVAADDATATALFEAAAGLARRTSSTLYLENLAPRWADLARNATGGTITRRTDCPAAQRRSDRRFADAWSARMAKNVRRRQRLLDEEGVTARWVAAGDGFEDALGELQRVHEARWNARGGTGRLSGLRVALLRDLATQCRFPDVPWILLLEREGRTVAALLGLRAGASFSVYKTGWDPAFTRLSPGIMAGVIAMQWAESQGLTTFDYLRGPRGHKHDLGCEAVADVSIVVPAGISGALLEQRERFASDGVRPDWWNRMAPAADRARRTASAAVARVRHGAPPPDHPRSGRAAHS